jgi:hypothetical protein
MAGQLERFAAPVEPTEITRRKHARQRSTMVDVALWQKYAPAVPDSTPPAGLCDDCQHCKQVGSARGSVFRLCLMHERDSRFAKYPRIPVLRCPGYVKKEPDGKT